LKNDTTIIVMDTKWKVLENRRVAREDIYQLYGYGKKYKEEHKKQKLYLIYPKTADLIGREYNYYRSEETNDLPLDVVFFDLSVDFKERSPLSKFIIEEYI